MKDPVTGELRQTMKRGFPTKREAQAWEASYKADTVRTSVTFAELDNLYIQYKNPAKQSTRDQETSRVRKYVTFADLPADRISKQVLLDWYLQFIKNDEISVSTKNYVIGVVKGACKFGADFYGLPNNTAILKKLKKDKKRKDPETWTPEEFAQFAQHVPHPYRDFYTFLFCVGCRRGEAMALRAEDFDLDAGTVRIYHQIRYAHEGFMPLKTASSERTIKLSPRVLEAVKPLVQGCGDGFVFGGEAPLPITNIQRYFLTGIRDSGVKRIRLHDLRHSFATCCICDGVNIVALSKYLGHATITQTLETYSHLLEKTADEMVGKVDLIAAVILP